MTDPSPSAPRGPGPPRGRGWPVLVLVAAALGIGLYALDRLNPAVLASTEGWMRLVAVAMILVLVAPAAFAGRLSRNLSNLMIWAGIILAIVFVYSQVSDKQITAFRAALMPQHDSAQTTGEARFRANRNGEFVVQGRINGEPVTFLVDTGASDVVLSQTDARRLGIDPDDLIFSRIYDTANGPVAGAPVRLNEVEVGGVKLQAVRASVNGGDLNQSLLGLSFLGRLSGFEVRDGVLTLYQ